MTEFKEFGKKGNPSVLFVESETHSFDDQKTLAELYRDYHVILSTGGGDVAASADAIERYMGYKNLFAVCGAPDGWNLIRELLSRQMIHADKVIVGNYENALEALIVPMLKNYALEAYIQNSTA